MRFFQNSNLHLHLLSAVLLIVLTLGMTWPLMLNLDTHVPTGQSLEAVSHLNLWTLAWNHHWLKGQSENYWDANQFYPFRKVLAYSEPQFGTALLTFPLVAFGATIVLAYNLSLLGFIWGTGISTYLFCWYLLDQKVSRSSQWGSAFVAALVLAFNPFVFQKIGVLQVLALPFPPLTLLGLHRFLGKKRWSDAIIFLGGFLGCWYTCLYYGLFLSLFVGFCVIIFWHRGLFCWRSLVIVAIVVVLLVPLASGMLSAKNDLSLDRPYGTVFELSPQLQRYFHPPHDSLLYGRILGLKGTTDPENNRFLGASLMLLAGLGTVISFQGSNASARGGQVEVSLQKYGKVYLFMAGMAFLLSFGPRLIPSTTIDMGIYKILVWLSPYNLLSTLIPGFTSMRDIGRFSIFTALFLSILVALGTLWLSQRVGSRFRLPFITLLISVTLLELWPSPLLLMRVPRHLDELPSVYQRIKKLPSDTVLLELPMRGDNDSARYLYRSIFHWLPLVNGYSGFSPRAYAQLSNQLGEAEAEKVLLALKAFGTDFILAHWNDLTNLEKDHLRELEKNRKMKRVETEENKVLYQLEDSFTQLFTPRAENLYFQIYESKQEKDNVTLCLYYQVDDGESFLVTPWQNKIECEVNWYVDSVATREGSEPLLTTKASYQNGVLMLPGRNEVEIDIPAPSPGQYKVLVRQQTPFGSVEMSGTCQLGPSGFVRFEQEE